MDCKVVQNYVITPVVLGQGCFGTVYRGYMKNNKNELLAVKAIPLDKIKNEQIVRREIEILLKLNSPNIVRFHKPAKTKNHLYFFLEYCQQDLKNYVKSKGGKLAETEVLDIFRQICNGFKEVHQKNIIHRDIKPANFLMHKGVVKIADFGFARVVDSVDQSEVLTFLGSPLYMAPQILAKQKFSSKCDIWSLGVTIYQILYGKPPYTAKSPPQLLENIRTKPLEFPQDIKRSDDIKNLLRSMLVIEQEKRISWNELFVHPVIKPAEESPQKSEDSLVQSFRENQIYMKRNKVVTKTTAMPDQEQIQSQKLEQNKVSEGDFATDLKMQQARIKQYAKIEEIDQHMRYRRNVSVFLNVQCNNFFSIAGQKLPELLFYMGLFALLKHQIMIHEHLQKMLCTEKPDNKFSEEVWHAYMKSSARVKVLKLIECDLKHLSSYFKQVKGRVSKSIRGNKQGNIVPVIKNFEQNFLQTELFNIESYNMVVSAIVSQLEKSGLKEPNFLTKLRITISPFKFLGEDIDFGIFYERENEELQKLRSKFQEL